MIVLTLEMVPVLLKLPSVSVSTPEPRLTLPSAMAVPSVIVSAPVPPISVSMLLTVPVLVAPARVSVLLPATEIDAHAGR